MLDYKLLKALAMVIDEGGFEKAAKKLHLTQSAVSQRLKMLEEHVGQILLTRTNPPAATTAGLEYLAHYRKVQQLESDLPPRKNRAAAQPFTSLAIAVNADSLGTWFLDAVEAIVKEQNIILDIQVDDQDETQKLLQNGLVSGCITTYAKVLQGCRMEKLGCVEYGIFCTPDFADKWFPGGMNRSHLATAPTIQFNRKDNFNDTFHALLFGPLPKRPPTFYVPSTEIFVDFVLRSLCYGVIPHQQSRPLAAAGELIDLAPACKVVIDLYFHYWNLKTAVMENFSREFIASTRKILQT